MQLDVQKIIDEVTPAVRDHLIESTKKEIASSISWTVQNTIREEVTRYVIEAVMPDVRERLKAQHAEMVEAMCQAVAVSMTVLRDKIIEQTSEQLNKSHVVSNVMKEIFGRGY
jgi:hypothetical protein